MANSYGGLITIEPGKCGGKPVISGIRFTVYDVLSHLAGGMTVDELLSEFPFLTREHVLACFAYAADRERTIVTSMR